MKKILLRISVIVSCVCVILEGVGVYLQSKKDLMIDDPDKFDAMMNVVHAGTCIKTIAALIAVAALVCWIAFGITWVISIRKNNAHHT